jgi:hypothetical protein
MIAYLCDEGNTLPGIYSIKIEVMFPEWRVYEIKGHRINM